MGWPRTAHDVVVVVVAEDEEEENDGGEATMAAAANAQSSDDHEGTCCFSLGLVVRARRRFLVLPIVVVVRSFTVILKLLFVLCLIRGKIRVQSRKAATEELIRRIVSLRKLIQQRLYEKKLPRNEPNYYPFLVFLVVFYYDGWMNRLLHGSNVDGFRGEVVL